jgi:hypothetical protein
MMKAVAHHAGAEFSRNPRLPHSLRRNRFKALDSSRRNGTDIIAGGTTMRYSRVCILVAMLALAGCFKDDPVGPSPDPALSNTPAGIANAGRTAPGQPDYEAAYVGGEVVWINAIDVPNRAPLGAQADFYEVVYPIGWQNLGVAPPQCNPCDHQHNGVDFTDFHDHVLDSRPGSPGHGEFSPLWHVFLVIPAYNGDSTHDAAVGAAFATHLPMKSEAAVDAALAAHMPDGSPLAVEVDTQFYFLCAVVNQHAAR